jgi:uncharacterized protein (UPF0128 family)
MTSKPVRSSESDNIVYTIEDFRRDFGDINTLFNMIEFSYNKIQLVSQMREEKNIIDLINEIIQLRESLSKKESSTDYVQLINLIIEFAKAILQNPDAVNKLKDVINALTSKS